SATNSSSLVVLRNPTISKTPKSVGSVAWATRSIDRGRSVVASIGAEWPVSDVSLILVLRRAARHTRRTCRFYEPRFRAVKDRLLPAVAVRGYSSPDFAP